MYSTVAYKSDTYYYTGTLYKQTVTNCRGFPKLRILYRRHLFAMNIYRTQTKWKEEEGK